MIVTNAVVDTMRDGIDPRDWDPNLDGVIAAPANHRVLYEDDHIRVLSVSIEPGETEPLHHHRLQSIMIIDRLVKLRDFDRDGREIPLPVPKTFDLPLVLKFEPQPLHAVRNEDMVAFHATRVEFKKGFPGKP